MSDERPSLKTYREKRRFEETPEPAGGGLADEAQRSFVVQKHWATRLHYDFRLELEGAMKSWAVPKGPSFDPADKRMAMPTEDHPIAYNEFEGVIPPGNYGAGKVIIWDKGSWMPLEDPHKGYRDGKLKFELFGHKLRGRWNLVRIKGREAERSPWLLIKERDAYARAAAEFSVVDEMPDSVRDLPDPPPSNGADPPLATEATQAPAPSGPPAGAIAAALPAELRPQLATLVDEPPRDAHHWIYEIKFDGYRMLTRAEGGKVRLITRNGNDWTHRLGQLARALQSMDLPDGWYDGEIIMPGEDMPADFQALQNAFDSARTGDIVYYLFDLPFCAGYDLRAVPLVERRAVLERIVMHKRHDKVRFSAVFEAPGRDVLESACKLGLEGVIAKQRDSHYVSRRTASWLKLKCARRQEFVIAGFTEPKGTRSALGSLLLGFYDEQQQLRYAGNVGTGFDERTLADLHEKLDAVRTDQTPFAPGETLPKGVHWVRPELVCEVSFGEWTREGRIRHSVFHGLRSDKPARTIRREQAAHTPEVASQEAATKGGAASARPRRASVAPRTSVRVSNPERLIDEQSGLTKIELVRYYALVAPLMMPHLQHRPLALVRAPDGINGQLFFQKRLDRYQMPGVVQLEAALFPGHPMLEIVSPEGLVSAAQMNAIEFHTWNAVKTNIGKPDRMTFDLDPGEGVPWSRMQQAAQLVRTLLEELGLATFLKTSGGKGLHVVVPLRKQFDWETVKDFSEAVVQHLARTLPDRFVAKSGPKNRVGRIFIDYLRNSVGATTICAWSARARPGLGISVPVRWEELGSLKSAAHWTVATVHTRLDEGNAPWSDYEERRCALTNAMKKLGFRHKEHA